MAAVKRVAEAGLLRAGAARLARLTRANRLLVLAYHNVVPYGEQPVGERSLYLPQAQFRAQLDHLALRCRVVPLDDAFAEGPAGKLPRVVITFDDAYLGAVTVGVEEVARRGLPATIFVATGFIGGGSFWWDTLAANDGAVPAHVRRHGLEECWGRDSDVRRWAAAIGLPVRAELPSFARATTLTDLKRAVAHSGVTVGSHTVSHPNLARLTPQEVTRELVDSREWLRSNLGSSAVPWLSYPYGLRSPAVMKAAAEAGYRGAFRVTGGWLRRDAKPAYDLPRLNVPAGLSDAGFALRIAGLLAR